MVNSPPVAIRVNGRLMGYVGSRYRGNPRDFEIERIGRLPRAQQRRATQALRRGNPASACRPGETEIYADVERIYAKKGRQSHAPHEPFVHDFRHAVACGCPDGTVKLRGRGGRRLWDLFKA
jgi:hypothetical protein